MRDGRIFANSNKKKGLRRQSTLDENGIISQVSDLHDTKIKTQNADKINLTTKII